jgi:hypothetical protein
VSLVSSSGWSYQNNLACSGTKVLVMCAVLLPIGLLVTSNLQSAMPALTGSANTTAYAVYNQVYSAFSLSAVVPIVAAAGVIISIIIGVFAWRRGAGGQ